MLGDFRDALDRGRHFAGTAGLLDRGGCNLGDHSGRRLDAIDDLLQRFAGLFAESSAFPDPTDVHVGVASDRPTDEPSPTVSAPRRRGRRRLPIVVVATVFLFAGVTVLKRNRKNKTPRPDQLPAPSSPGAQQPSSRAVSDVIGPIDAAGTRIAAFPSMAARFRAVDELVKVTSSALPEVSASTASRAGPSGPGRMVL